MQCQFCGKEFKNAGGKKVHENSCADNPNRKVRTRSPLAGRKKGSVPWNKGKSYEQLYLEGKISYESFDRIMDNLRQCGLNSSGKASTPEGEMERIAKIKEKSKNNGGYRLGSGLGKKGIYRGIYCDSSYELAYVIYCIDHGIKIERCPEVGTYEFEGQTRKYIPDFLVEGVTIVEIKGYSPPQWEAKHRCNPDVTVLFGEDLKHVFEYVVNRYGKNFVDLYEEDGAEVVNGT